MARKVFFSFYYDQDVMRVSQVREMGSLEHQPILDSNDWEKVERNGPKAIQNWIDREMSGKDCLVVLIGAETASRPWVAYEIQKAWDLGMGVVGIYIHGLKDPRTGPSRKGANPFPATPVGRFGPKRPMNTVVKAYDPQAGNEYAWIKQHLPNAVEEAIQIRLVH